MINIVLWLRDIFYFHHPSPVELQAFHIANVKGQYSAVNTPSNTKSSLVLYPLVKIAIAKKMYPNKNTIANIYIS